MIHFPDPNPDLAPLDARIGLPGETHDCFLCGRKVEPNAATNDPHFISSPVMGGIRLACHGACAAALSDIELSARYQQAAFAALTGGKERPWR